MAGIYVPLVDNIGDIDLATRRFFGIAAAFLFRRFGSNFLDHGFQRIALSGQLDDLLLKNR